MICNELPDGDRPLFNVYWRGRKNKKYSGWWHTPDIMDGGYIASYCVKDGVCRVEFSQDGFAFSTPIEIKEFKIEKRKEYEIYITDNHIVVPGAELTTIWDKEIEKAEQKRLEEEQERHRREHPEEYQKLSDGSYVPRLRLIRQTNPVSIKDKIFTDFAIDQEDKTTVKLKCF